MRNALVTLSTLTQLISFSLLLFASEKHISYICDTRSFSLVLRGYSLPVRNALVTLSTCRQLISFSLLISVGEKCTGYTYEKSTSCTFDTPQLLFFSLLIVVGEKRTCYISEKSTKFSYTCDTHPAYLFPSAARGQ